MTPRLPKALTLRVTVVARELRFATNMGINFSMNVVGLGEDFRARGDHNFLTLAVPPKKYWDSLHEDGYLFIGNRMNERSAHWPHHMAWAALSPEEEAQLRSRRFSVTEFEFSKRREALDTWASMFAQPLVASLVAAAVSDRLDLLPDLLLDSGYSYDFHSKEPRNYNSREHGPAFRAMLTENLDGVLMTMPQAVK